MSDENVARQGQRVLTDILNFDLDRKTKLVEVYNDILQLTEELQGEQCFLDELKIEFGDFQNLIPNFKEILLEAECPIIIAGETSAGKSGFINLLIGRDILPVSTLACTSTIVKIRNADEILISITPEKGDKKEILFYPDPEPATIQKVLKKYVSLKGSNEETISCKCVDIHVPVPMLKGNTVIVDTPGIGTTANPELTARLFEFLPRAVAFIYIIDAGHAGGLETDRLLSIFEEQRKLKQSGKLIEFDVSRTIFVCNKWDLVEGEEDDVLQHVRKTLSEHWPNFDEKQLFLLSVKEEKKLAKEQRSSENYQKLLCGIENLIPNSLEAKTVMNASWQYNFLTKTIERIYGRIKWSCKSQQERLDMNKAAEKRLHILSTSISKVMKDLISKAEIRCADLSRKANLHLNHSETKKKMFQWTNNELLFEDEYPHKPITSIGKMKLRAELLIDRRIWRELYSFLNTEEIETLRVDFDNMLLAELQLFDEQSKEVRALILDYKIPDDPYELLKGIAIGTAVIIALPVCLPLSVLSLLTLPFLLNRDKFISLKEKHTIEDFKLRPLEFMIKWSDEILPRFSEKRIYSYLSSNYIEDFRDKVRNICGKIIPQQIDADTIYIKNVTQDIRSYIDIRTIYLPFGDRAKCIMGKLLITYIEYFPHYSDPPAELRSCEHAQTLEGRFAHVREIEMMREQNWVKAVVKSMKQPLQTDSSLIQLTEVNSIRNVNHPNIVQVYGISIRIDYQGYKYLELRMEHCSESLENLILKNKHFVPCGNLKDWNIYESEKSKAFYIKTMSGISTGIAHLHEAGFIHKNLKMSNVFIKDRVAKIADAGLLQPTEHICTIGGIYLPTAVAPEIFTDKYCERTESDIYSIGILMWEVYYGRPAFKLINEQDSESKNEKSEEYTIEVKDAQQLIDYVKTGQRLSFEKNQPVPALMKLISKCWNNAMDKRPTANTVTSKLLNLI